MTRLSLLALGLIALALALDQASAAAPSAQAQTPGLTPPVAVLTIEELRITPDVVVAGDPFMVAFKLWNRTEFFIEQLALTVKDLDADALLTSTTGVKTTYYNQPGRGILAAVELRLKYAGAAVGPRRLALGLEYIYYVGGQRVVGRQAETLAVQVAAPTPTRTATPTFTATATFTFTPSRTPSATPTRRPPPAPPTVNYPATQVVLLETVTAQARPTPPATPAPAPPPAPPRPLPARSALVIEFAGAPAVVAPGQIITMALVVRNIGSAEAEGVVARFDAAENALIPIGQSTQWFLGAIPPAAQIEAAGQFYVAGDGALGRARVTVEYDDVEGAHETTAEINIPIPTPTVAPAPTADSTSTPAPRGAPQPGEPWWRRLLRAIFGGGN